jgi:hypothetical protein
LMSPCLPANMGTIAVQVLSMLPLTLCLASISLSLSKLEVGQVALSTVYPADAFPISSSSWQTRGVSNWTLRVSLAMRGTSRGVFGTCVVLSALRRLLRGMNSESSLESPHAGS